MRLPGAVIAVLLAMVAVPAAADVGYPEATIESLAVSFPRATYSGGEDKCAADTKCPEHVYTLISGKCFFDWDAASASSGHHWMEDSVKVGYWSDVKNGYLTKAFVQHSGGSCQKGGTTAITPFLYGAARDCKPGHNELAYSQAVYNLGNSSQLSWSRPYHITIPALECKKAGGSGGSSGGSGSGGGVAAPKGLWSADGTAAMKVTGSVSRIECLSSVCKAHAKVMTGEEVLELNSYLSTPKRGAKLTFSDGSTIAMGKGVRVLQFSLYSTGTPFLAQDSGVVTYDLKFPVSLDTYTDTVTAAANARFKVDIRKTSERVTVHRGVVRYKGKVVKPGTSVVGKI